jgi:putative endonuclease
MNNRNTLSNNKKRIGMLGEDTACKFLMKHGYKILQRNYWKKWGEIDIIAKYNGIVHFVEVKSVSCENLDIVTHETDDYNPEENVHPWKLKRLSRVIQTYLNDKDIDDDWQFDVLSVFLDLNKKEARVRFMENIVI